MSSCLVSVLYIKYIKYPPWSNKTILANMLFSGDRVFASAGADGVLNVYDLSKDEEDYYQGQAADDESEEEYIPQMVASHRGHRAAVLDFAFCPDIGVSGCDGLVASVSADGGLQIWRLDGSVLGEGDQADSQHSTMAHTLMQEYLADTMGADDFGMQEYLADTLGPALGGITGNGGAASSSRAAPASSEQARGRGAASSSRPAPSSSKSMDRFDPGSLFGDFSAPNTLDDLLQQEGVDAVTKMLAVGGLPDLVDDSENADLEEALAASLGAHPKDEGAVPAGAALSTGDVGFHSDLVEGINPDEEEIQEIQVKRRKLG